MDNRSSYFSPDPGGPELPSGFTFTSLHFYKSHVRFCFGCRQHPNQLINIFDLRFLPSLKKKERKKKSTTNCIIIIRRRKKAAILLVSSRLNFFNNDISNLSFVFQATNNVRSHFRSVSFLSTKKKSKRKNKTEMKKSFLLIRPHCICFGTWELRG